MESKWVKTDDFQFVKKIEEKIFDTINIIEHNHQYLIGKNEINLNCYKEKEITEAVKTFGYNDYEDIQREYKENADFIVAEILSELEFYELHLIRCTTIFEVNQWLSETSEELIVE